MVKLPSTGHHYWYGITLVRSHDDLGDVGTQVEDKGMQASAKADRACDTKADPVESEHKEIDYTLTLL